MLEPAAVALQVAFLAVLLLFIVWVARSALRDLRRADDVGSPAASSLAPSPPQALSRQTGVHVLAAVDPRLVVERAPGHVPGMEYEIGDGAVLGRGEQAQIRLDDPFASARHARLTRQGGLVVLEDLGSTNGTYLNEELVDGPRPLHQGDRLRIGDSEFTYTAG